MKNKKREIILLIIGILGLVSLMVGATYAFFKAQTGPAAISDITTTTATTDNFTFSTDGEIILNISNENLANGQGNVQDSSIAKARLIANNKTNTTTKQYNVYFLIEENDIEYSSYTKDGTTQSFKTSKEKEDFDLTGYEPVPEMVMSVRKNNEVYNSDIKRINKLSDNTYDITEEEGLYLIGENVPITSTKDVTDTWEVIITYKNLSTNQQLNVGHSLKGKIIITSEKLLYEINNDDELRQLSSEVNGGDSKEGKYYVLTNNIDLGPYEEGVSNFTSIGTDTNRFKGNFNGDNHTISNLYIYNTITSAMLGLFGYVTDASVSNLKVTGNVTSKVTAVAGGIIGSISGTGNISNLINKVNVTSEVSSWDAGGVVGANYGTVIIQNCRNYGNIEGSNNTGGIVGYNNANLTIENSVNNGEINNQIGVIVGGLVGLSNSSTGNVKITNSYNEGTIVQNSTKGNTRAGGLIAQINGSAFIENSYNNGNIESDLRLYSANSQNMYGGLIGRKENSGKVIINKSYNKGNIEVIGNSYTAVYIGGIIGDLYGDNKNGTAAYIINSYNLGNFTNASGRTSRKSGIIGEIYLSSSVWVLNSYNKGNITGTDIGLGILLDNSNDAVNNMYLNNVFNLGNLNCPINLQIYRPVSLAAGQANLDYKNVYYIKGLNATNRTDLVFTPKTIDQMKAQLFVDELNNNIKSIHLEEIDPILKDYTLVNWKLGDDSYPTLDF